MQAHSVECSPRTAEASPPAAVPVRVESHAERLERLELQITELWAHVSAASYRFLELVAEYDRVKGYEQHGLVNSAQWLNWQCGIGDVAAREKVRVARALETLPKIRDAFRRGMVSYSKVRAMTRVATSADEHVLLNTALHGTAAHVERHVRRFRWCERRDAAREANARHVRRYLSCFEDADGSLVVHAVLPPEVGAVVRQALEAALEDIDEPAAVERADGTAAAPDSLDVPDSSATLDPAAASGAPDESDALGATDGSGTRDATLTSDSVAPADRAPDCETRSNVSAETCPHLEPIPEISEHGLEHPAQTEPLRVKRADALCRLAERYLADRARTPTAADGPFLVTVHVDQRLLAWPGRQDTASPSGRERYCEIEGSDAALAVETARRLACDASLVGIVDGPHGEPLSVGRRTRAIPPALKRALRIRDGGCRFPGCGRSKLTEAHHVRHWADGGETKLGNLVTLCRFHHRLIHEGGYGLQVLDDGPAAERFVFTRPDGSRVEPSGRYSMRVRAVSRPAGQDVEPSGRVTLESLLFELNRQRGLDIGPRTIRSRWTGESMDYSAAVEAMRYERARMEPDPSR